MDLLIEPRGAWVKLTLNRPTTRNALTTALLAQVAEVLTSLATDPANRAVMICGAGGHFAAGADITEIAAKTSAEAADDPRIAHWAAIREYPKPLVAAVDGYALGGGLELALMADCLVLGPGAKLGLPETNLGLIPGAGGGQRLMALIGRARASRMVLTGEIIDAATALDWGLAGWLVDNAIATAETLTATLADRAPLALQAAKRALVKGDERYLAFTTERRDFEALLDTADKSEGIAAHLARRAPKFTGQ